MKRIVAGILAHVDSGKTTLSEALLYCSGSIKERGRVDAKNSFLDNFYLERSRGITIFSKQALLNLGETSLTLLDTPGHVDFSAEAERTLQVLDYAVLVISAPDGVQSHTITLWKLLKKYRVPTFIFVNKTDLENAGKAAILSQLKAKLSDGVTDFADAGSDDFYEEAAMCSDELLNEYDESGSVADESIVKAIKARKIFPCMFGSALRLEGVEEFSAVFDKFTQMPAYGEEFAGKVYKISQDAQGNRLTHLKVTGGSLKVREIIKSKKNKNNEKVTAIRMYSGEKFTAVDEAAAGAVCAVTGLSFLSPGDGLGAQSDSFSPVLEPVLTYKLEPVGADVHTALAMLRQLEEEDPQLNIEYSESRGEIQLRLMGDIQLEVLTAIIRDRFGFEPVFSQGSIIYKETIENTVEGVGHFEPLKHYAEVHLILKPLARGSGLVFRTDCREDRLDKNWQRLILTHLYEKTHLGILTGSPITDMEISLASGRAHTKHTEGGDFRQATYRAVRQGLMEAKSILLEPVYEFTLEVPDENVGRAMSDITMMSGSFEPPETDGEFSTLRGTAPVSEMRGYHRDVISYTKGRGRLSCAVKGYDKCHNQDEVVQSFGYNPEADTLNTADSVFCSHGAGHNVKWSAVKSRMHLPSALSAPSTPENKGRRDFARFKTQKNIFAADKELIAIFEQTYGPIKRKSAPDSRRRVTSDDNIKQKQKPARQSYDGDEYVLVDGYNVIFSWEHLRKLAEDNIDGARSALTNILCNYQGYTKCELILVFDAYKVRGGVGSVERENGISVVYTKEAETADMYIEKVTRTLSKRHRVRVVTSDAMEQLIILGGGALRVSSIAFLEEVREAEEEIRRIISD